MSVLIYSIKIEQKLMKLFKNEKICSEFWDTFFKNPPNLNLIFFSNNVVTTIKYNSDNFFEVFSLPKQQNKCKN